MKNSANIKTLSFFIFIATMSLANLSFAGWAELKNGNHYRIFAPDTVAKATATIFKNRLKNGWNIVIAATQLPYKCFYNFNQCYSMESMQLFAETIHEYLFTHNSYPGITSLPTKLLERMEVFSVVQQAN